MIHLLTRRQGYFNPRLREGGDEVNAFVDEIPGMISIHASAREATYFGAGTGSSLVDFNPRLREGGDRKQFTYQH